MKSVAKSLSGVRALLLAVLPFGILGLPVSAFAGPKDNNLVVFDGISTNLGRTLEVGHNGTNNTVVISGGASVTDSGAYIGFAAAAARNTVLVTGPNSSWRNNGPLYVGRNGSGNILAIHGGARVFAQQADVGETPPGSGNRIEVSGGSELTVTNSARTAVCQVRLGSLVLDEGTVRADRLVIAPGGALSGAGTVIGATTNAGSLSPGLGIGTLSFTGDVTLTASSLVDVEIGGYEAGATFDLMRISGRATLGGTLRVWLRNGFVPGSGSRFSIATAGTITGDVANLILANGPTGLVARALVEGNALIVEFDGGGDSDSDGLPDAWEQEYFGDLDEGPGDDSDGDGESNYAEYLADTVPTDKHSRLKVSLKAMEKRNVVEFDSSTNRVYTLMYSAKLMPRAAWSNLNVEVTGWGGLMQLIDANPAQSGFYRVKVSAP